jgi:fatty acid desaturase
VESNGKLELEREYAAVVRDLIQRENEITNHRFTWMLILQGILFAATASLFSVHWFPVVVLACLGIMTSLSFSVGLVNSSKSRRHLRASWQERMATRQELMKDMPPIDGAYPTKFTVLQPWIFIPVVVVVTWLMLLGFVIRTFGFPKSP